ncbi:SDR family NAD(P)-dependent oxidoreductase [Rhodococcus koreensis]
MTKTWYITGASRGFGRAWAEAALERGDKVAATARDLSSLDQLIQRHGAALLPIELDVTDRSGSFTAIEKASEYFGAIDIVVNNAGYGHRGFVEELTEDEAREQMETNFFGALWTTQAALPVLKRKGGGHIVQVSSIGGIVAFPGLGIYHASKWALEGLTEALAPEVAAFGIRTTLVEPGGYATDWGTTSARHSAEPLADYQEIREAVTARSVNARPVMPVATDTVEAILAIVDAPEPPARIILGSSALGMALSTYEARATTWRAWESTSISADAVR